MKQVITTASGKRLRIKSTRQWAKSNPQDFVKSILGDLHPTLTTYVNRTKEGK